MAIITISRKIGSMGDKIAKMTAETLGYEYIEKAHISEGLSRCGIPISDIDKYDEKNHRYGKLFRRRMSCLHNVSEQPFVNLQPEIML